jgi:hypothetical protein
VATFGGPLNIPHLMPRGPNFFVNYQWLRDRIAITDSGLVPTLERRRGMCHRALLPSIPARRLCWHFIRC